MEDDSVNEITVLELEEQIFQLEGIVVRIRAPSKSKVLEYGYTRCAPGNQKVSLWLNTRVAPCLRGLEISVISGSFGSVLGQTTLSNLRDSYVRRSK
jgi:hypothetical protein